MRSRTTAAQLPPEVWTLAVINGVAAMSLVVAGALYPLSPNAPVRLGLVLAVLAVSFAVALVTAFRRPPRALLHAAVAGAAVLASVLVSASATTGGVVIDGFAYPWLAAYAGFFFSPRARLAHTTLITVAFGVGLLFAAVPGGLAVWLMVSGTAWAAATVIGRLSTMLHQLAVTDPLTGLLNRDGFARAAAQAQAIAGRSGAALTLVALDLDGFKAINDRDGHLAGDRHLAALAEAWRCELRAGDVLARFGGDEFLLLLPATSPDGAWAKVERLRSAHPGRWSVGITEWPSGEDLQEAIARADAELYEAKSRGRIAIPA